MLVLVHVYPVQVLQDFCRESPRLICQIDLHDLAFLLFRGDLTLFQHFFFVILGLRLEILFIEPYNLKVTRFQI